MGKYRSIIFVLTSFFIFTSTADAQSFGSDFQSIPNRDITANLNNPTRSRTWDYILNGDLCFAFNPPSNGGNFSVELTMDLKDETDPSIIQEEIIGADTKRITNPHTVRCSSSTLRKPVFNAPFNIPDPDRWTESCPQIKVKVTTIGRWNPIPQQDIAYIKNDFLCPGGVPTPGGGSSPTTPPSTPTTGPGGGGSTPTPIATTAPTATPVPKTAIEGRVNVFTCSNPEDVRVNFCDSATGDCQELELASGPTDHGVWLDDTLDDRTLIYNYKATQDKNGDDLEVGKTYYVFGANAFVKRHSDNHIATFESSFEDKKAVVAPGTRDLTVFTSAQSCACTFRAVARIRDAATGEITTALDELQVPGKDLTYGTSNDRQIIQRGDKPVSPFTNGSLVVEEDLFGINYKELTGAWGLYGIDGIANVRIYAPGYNVVRHKCQTSENSDVFACPGGRYSEDYNYEDEKNFYGFRVACGVDVEYDWYIEKKAGTTTIEVVPPENVDINGDGFINTTDLVSCIDEWGQEASNLECDINKDQRVDALDLSLVTSLQGTDVSQ